MTLLHFKACQDGQLTADQCDYFEQNGVLILDNYFSPLQAILLKQRMADLIREYYCRPDLVKDFHFIFEKEEERDAQNRLFFQNRLLNKVSATLHIRDRIFREFSHQPKIRTTLGHMGYAQPILLQSMYIFKSPGIRQAVEGHQDASFIHVKPKPVIGLWFALEDANENNGCLWVLPGRHHEPLRNKLIKYPDDRLEFEFYQDDPWPWQEGLAVEVPCGSLVFLHGHLPHGSYPNKSQQSRHAFTLHGMDGDCQLEKTAWLAPRMCTK